MFSTTELNIYDEDGFIAIANGDKYKTFVHSDWQFDQLLNHFVQEMNNDSLIIWATNLGGGQWKVKFQEQPSDAKSFRQISKTIEVTSGELYLTNYTDLTMAAQFADEKIPAKINANLSIKLENGKYDLTVRQMFDPENYDYQSEDNSFEIIVKPTSIIAEKVDKVFWWTE